MRRAMQFPGAGLLDVVRPMGRIVGAGRVQEVEGRPQGCANSLHVMEKEWTESGLGNGYGFSTSLRHLMLRVEVRARRRPSLCRLAPLSLTLEFGKSIKKVTVAEGGVAEPAKHALWRNLCF
eukprot:CAMPEP_0171088708 /NCGR_PEP_ID=MMETSP0766_2-20121228/20942_1 /TAXON_ID=439317 /ORGANISM="Gambierdiscus australes, Strain CAWD 149" /LENGTH=121 /DNA_ID=CAMNT_0011546521 /DNA_START=17 /DNA_END=380 /DNA_ORIENTATION=-